MDASPEPYSMVLQTMPKTTQMPRQDPPRRMGEMQEAIGEGGLGSQGRLWQRSVAAALGCGNGMG